MWWRRRYTVTVTELPIRPPIAREARWVYAGGMSANPPVEPHLWQVVLTVDGMPATDENTARAVLVAIGLGDKIELEEEAPEYGIWLAGLPFLPLPQDGGMAITVTEARVIMANGEFQMEVPLP